MTERPEYNPGDSVTLYYPWDDEHRPYRLDSDDFAVMSEADGTVVDVATNRETAECMVLEGYIATLVGEALRERYEVAFDALREVYLDCWGE